MKYWVTIVKTLIKVLLGFSSVLYIPFPSLCFLFFLSFVLEVFFESGMPHLHVFIHQALHASPAYPSFTYLSICLPTHLLTSIPGALCTHGGGHILSDWMFTAGDSRRRLLKINRWRISFLLSLLIFSQGERVVISLGVRWRRLGILLFHLRPSVLQCPPLTVHPPTFAHTTPTLCHALLKSSGKGDLGSWPMVHIQLLPWDGSSVGFGFPTSAWLPPAFVCECPFWVLSLSRYLLAEQVSSHGCPPRWSCAHPFFMPPTCHASLEIACLLILPSPICLWGFIPLHFFNILEVRSQEGEDNKFMFSPIKFHRGPKDSFLPRGCWMMGSAERAPGNWRQSTFRCEVWRLTLPSLTEK